MSLLSTILKKSRHFIPLYFICLLYVLTPTNTQASGGTFGGGDGSLGSPYQIEDCADLQAINNNSSAYYVLIDDVDCFGTSFTALNVFGGSLNGQDHIISNITISAGGSPYQGLFSNISMSGSVTRLGLSNITVTGGAYVGGLAGTSSGDVSEVFATGTISCGNYCGGLIGVSDGPVTTAYTNVAVSGGIYVGGVIGTTGMSSPTDIYARGAVSGSVYVGGVIGAPGGFGDEYNSFYDQTTTGQSGVYGGVAKTTTQMKSISTYTNLSSSGLTTPWDFVGTAYNDTGNDDIWDIDPALNGGYPFFTWQYTDLAAPSAPTNFDGEESGSTAVLYWTNPTTGDFSSLTVRRSTSEYPTSVSGGSAVVSNTTTVSFSDTGLADQTYYYSIFGLDNNGNVSVAATTSLRIDTTGPSAPSAFVGTVSSTSVIFSWTNPVDSDFSGNMIRRSTSSFPATTASGTLVATYITGETETDTGLSDGVYYFSIFAFDTYGNGSTIATTTVTIDTTAPVITLLGDSVQTITFGQSYADPGATALDAIDGSRTGNIVVSGSVTSNVAGQYTLSYNVSDTSGNVATTVSRYVTVSPASGGYLHVIAPLADDNSTDFSVRINGEVSEEYTTNSQTVSLSFNANPEKVKGYAVSLNPEFSGTSILPYASNVSYTLPNTPGTYTLYIRFYSSTGHASTPIVRKVIFTTTAGSSAPSTPSTTQNTLSPFLRNLRKGMSGKDVIALQKYLNAHGAIVSLTGAGSLGKETAYFGNATVNAVARFQELHAEQLLKPYDLTKGTGLFLQLTRAFVNKTLE